MIDGAAYITSILGEAPKPAAVKPAGPALEFTIRKFALALLLDKAATVIPTREVMPVLKNFLIEVTPQRLRVTATDLELSMIATTELVTVATAGTAVFPAKRFADIVREAEDGDVTVKVTGGVAHIAIGRTAWTIKLQTGHDYPRLPEVTEVVFTEVPRTPFLAAIQGVRYAACKDTANRGSLMMIDVTGGRMTACDGSRFQQAVVENLPFDFRLPIGAVDDLVRLLKMSELDTIQIGEATNHLIFRFAQDVFIISKLIARFPDLDQMWLRPALENKHTLTVDRAHLLTAVKRVRINADTETSAVALVLDASGEGGSITVSARDKYGNTANETIEAGWTGPARTLVVNHGYLADLLTGTTAKSCTFRLGEDTKTRKSPLLLKDPDSGAVGVLQQMLTDWATA